MTVDQTRDAHDAPLVAVWAAPFHDRESVILIPATSRPSGRKVLHLPARLRLPTLDYIEVRTLDIGTDGMCVAAKAAIASNTLCTVQISALPAHTNSPRLELPVRVVYCIANVMHGIQIGLHFQDLSADARQTLDRLLAADQRLNSVR